MKKTTHIGVYALIQKDDSMLLIEKVRGPYTGMWDLPGGSIEFGETPLEALHREVLEETGLSISQSELLNILSHNVTYKNKDNENETIHHIGMLYRVEINPNNTLKNDSDGEDSLGAKWIKYSVINKADFSPFANQSITYVQG